ncbi:MAG: S8 family serine peptidase [Saprospiraceae bacterium]|nr:S8 family serine peptidase [Saprospiraceae bacterium]
MAKKSISENKNPEFTGRYLILLPERDSPEGPVNSIHSATGLTLKKSSEFTNSVFSNEDLNNCDGIVLENIGVAIVNKSPKFENSINSLSSQHNMLIEPERVVHAINLMDENSKNYLMGYRDGINGLISQILEENFEENGELITEDEVSASSVGITWGLRATNVVPISPFFTGYSGFGVKVAILDTGFDFNHPDFVGRQIIHSSFISGQSTQDLFGHGTHCTGTACGPLNPAGAFPRYGIAYASQIHIGKVLNNSGSGTDGQILAGINWAYGQGCAIISMSLGARTSGPGFSAVFEATASNLLNNGVLIIAAAGNDSNRPGLINPVSHPANCPSIMAVGAIDSNMNIATFSNGGIYPTYGAVDIVGPGVQVFSALSNPHNALMGPAGIIRGNANGTSMAAPHVAGIAALWGQATGLRGNALWNKLSSTAKNLPQHPTRDVGAGLVQAPQKRKWPIFKHPPFKDRL